MEREKVQRYVANLEQIVRSTCVDIRETMILFQGYSQWFNAERTIPPGIISHIRKTYRGIHDQLAKVKGINQLLETRYRQYYSRDPLRDKELLEYGFLAKNLNTRFESMLQTMEKKRALEGKEGDPGVVDVPIPSQWFRFRENQIHLLRNLQALYELDYKTGTRMGMEQRRRVTEDRLRSLSLFALSGEGGAMDNLQSRMRLREYDIRERCTKEELRGALTHLREISLAEAESVIKRFIGSSEVPRIKGLLFSIQSQEDLGKLILGSADSILKGMRDGEVKTIPI
jgi:hypothetical protein